MNVPHYNIKSYFIGFILSIILTVIPFYSTKYCNELNKITLLLIIISCAVVQVYIHLILFLHLKDISDQMWHFISLIFTIFIIFILILGSVWIMMHLDHNLMI